jgi:caffeoyl-CoA O-methyltransferase
MRRDFLVGDDITAYVAAHTPAPDSIKEALIAETATLPDPGMQVSPQQGALLGLLVAATGARNVLEVGTFTGLSALCMAEALTEGGTLVCCDVSREWTDIARRFWEAAGVADRIDLRIGKAADTLLAMPAEPTFDLVFLDADKAGYPDYLELIVPLLQPGGLLVADNVLWSGRVVDPAATDASTEMLRRFNDLAAADPRLQTHLLPLYDGLLVARRLPDTVPA